MPALTLFIIRHAEKPGKGTWPGPGSTFDGTADDKSMAAMVEIVGAHRFGFQGTGRYRNAPR